MMVAGFGFRAAATAESLRSAYRAAAGGRAVAALAAPADKAALPALTDFARETGLPLRPVAPAAMALAETITQSQAALAHRRVGSVAEAAALAAAGKGARLIAARSVSADRMATCALAEGEDE